MMPVVRIPDPIFERLQAIAKPFVDTPASVIERLLDFYEARESGGGRRDTHPSSLTNANIERMEFNPYDAPDLTHTRVIRAELAHEKATNWNELVQLAHRKAIDKVKDVPTLRSATLSNIVAGRKADSGFQYLPDANISIQNVQANTAWKNTFHLARRFNLEVLVDFEWPYKDGAAMPGKQGRLAWIPEKTGRTS